MKESSRLCSHGFDTFSFTQEWMPVMLETLQRTVSSSYLAFRDSLSLAWNWPDMLDWLPSEPQESTLPPVLGLQECVTSSALECGF